MIRQFRDDRGALTDLVWQAKLKELKCTPLFLPQPDNPWTPNTEEERAAVLRQMDRLLNSRHFRNSKRYPALLGIHHP